jgi:hypothetical protein
MKTIADQLPPEIAKQLHPARRKNEAEYWAVRAQLLAQYEGQWVGPAKVVVNKWQHLSVTRSGLTKYCPAGSKV